MIRDLVALYRACFQASIALELQYRLSAVIWMIGMVLQPVMYLVVWRTVAGAGTVGGYDASDFAAYYLVLMLVNHLTFTWIMHEYDFEVRQGNLSAKLLKPVHPIHMHLADNIAFKLLTLAVIVPSMIALSLYFKPKLQPSVEQIGLFAIALAMAFAVRWVIEYTLALAAFWTTRVNSVNNIFFSAHWFLSGMVAPNEVLPGVLREIAGVMPFRYMVAFPIEVLLGRVEGVAIVQGFAFQIAWLAIAIGVLRLFWRRGLRRYSAVGA